jgi:hypothetical protein
MGELRSEVEETNVFLIGPAMRALKMASEI